MLAYGKMATLCIILNKKIHKLACEGLVLVKSISIHDHQTGSSKYPWAHTLELGRMGEGGNLKPDILDY